MTTKRADGIFAALLLLFGVYLIYSGLQLGYLQRNVPGPGFFPFWCGLVVAVLSAVNLARCSFGLELHQANVNAAALAPILGLSATLATYLLVTPWLGMLLPLPAMALIAAFAIEPRMDRRMFAKVVVTAAALPLVCFAVFRWFLRIPIIPGPLGF
jgi:putative tricarboxylic transport membrane protein